MPAIAIKCIKERAEVDARYYVVVRLERRCRPRMHPRTTSEIIILLESEHEKETSQLQMNNGSITNSWRVGNVRKPPKETSSFLTKPLISELIESD
jgi:hypothetical protein